jgi:hypothetical protein
MRSYPWQFDQKNYTDAYLLGCVSEECVQNSILQLLTAEHIPALATDAGAKKVRGAIARRLAAAGAKEVFKLVAGTQGAAYAGLPDIIGTLPGGQSLYIEVKAPAWYRIGCGNRMRSAREAGEPTKEQLAFLDTMAEAGAVCMVAWSSLDVEDVLSRLVGQTSR